MTAPIAPQSKRMRLDQYRWAQREGYSDDELREQGYELPLGSNKSPAQQVTPVRSLGERVKGSVAAAAQTAIPVAGAVGAKLVGWDDEAEATRAATREKVGTLPLLGAEIAGGIASGSSLMNLLGKADQTSKAVRLAKLALGGSQNKGTGFREGVKRMGVNVGSGAAVGAVSAPEGSEGMGALFGGVAGGVLPAAIGGLVRGVARGREVAGRYLPWNASRARSEALSDAATQFHRANLSPQDIAARARARIAADKSKAGPVVADIFDNNPITERMAAASGDGLRDETVQAREALRATLNARAADAKGPKEMLENITGLSRAEAPAKRAGVVGNQMRQETAKAYRAAHTDDEILTPGLKQVLSTKSPKNPKRTHILIRRAKRMTNADLEAGVAKGEIPEAFRSKTTPVFDAESGVTLIGQSKTSSVPIRNARYWDLFSKNLRSLGWDKSGPIKTPEGNEARKFFYQLDGAMGDEPAFEGLREARRLSAAEKKVQKGIALGQKEATAADPRAPAVALDAELAKGSTVGNDAARAERRGALVRQLLAREDDALAKELSTERGWRRITDGLGDPAAEAELRAGLEERVRRKLTAERLGQGTKSPAGPSTFDSFGFMTPWDIASLLRGSPTLAIAHGVAAAQRKASKGNISRTNEQLLRLAGEPLTPQRAAELVRAARARSRQPADPTRAAGLSASGRTSVITRATIPTLQREQQ